MAVPNECNKRKGILKIFDRETETFEPALRNPLDMSARLVHSCPCEARSIQNHILQQTLRGILEGELEADSLPSPEDFRYDYLDEEPPEFTEPVVTDTHLADSLVRKIFEGAKR